MTTENESLLTATDANQGGEQAADVTTTVVETSATDAAKPETKAPEAPKAAEVPEKYEFKAPEGMEFNAELNDKFQASAKELGLTQAQAQKLVDLHVQGQKAATDADVARRAGWGDLTKADKDVGGDKLGESLATAKKAIDAYFDADFKEMLNVTGLGNHPSVVKGLVKIGKTLSQDNHVAANRPTAPTKTLEQRLYPNSPQA